MSFEYEFNPFTGTFDIVTSSDTLSNLAKSSLEVLLEGGSSGGVIVPGEGARLEIPFDGTITRVALASDLVGSIQIDIWKDTYDNYPPTDANSITGGNEPVISGSNKYEDETLSGWTVDVSQGDILIFNVDSVANIAQCLISLTIEKA